jgi:hypothetical protein
MRGSPVKIRLDRRINSARRTEVLQVNAPEPKYWFTAKRYGYGWGLPCSWQGWTTLIAWMIALSVGLRWLIPGARWHHMAFAGAMAILLVLICYWKGEPARWRWGE